MIVVLYLLCSYCMIVRVDYSTRYRYGAYDTIGRTNRVTFMPFKLCWRIIVRE